MECIYVYCMQMFIDKDIYFKTQKYINNMDKRHLKLR